MPLQSSRFVLLRNVKVVVLSLRRWQDNSGSNASDLHSYGAKFRLLTIINEFLFRIFLSFDSVQMPG